MRYAQSNVSDVMTQTVVAVSRTAVYKEIVRTLSEWNVSAVPVLEGEGRVIGVVSEADLLSKEEHKDRDPAGLDGPHRLSDLAKAGARTAEDVMSTPAVTVRGYATVAEAARAMAHGGFKRLPVVDAEGRLVGIVSRSDLLKVYLRRDDDIAAEIRDDVIAPLFPHREPTVEVRVEEGVVALSGHMADTALIPLVTRLVRAVEGVVCADVRLDAPVA
ncbi:CBS domain-containing protein [Streptomyces cinnamoneus]|uniref:CBS domain-containing protein n=1 Tax=Streptomyces cinnamoneus TaxID=53446 RepID=UPI0037B567E0